MIYNSLHGIYTTMIGFVTWPPFLYYHIYKGGQVTKPIIVVKMPCKLLYIVQVKRFLITSWPYLISKVLIACDHLQCCFLLASHFLQPGCFCLASLSTIVLNSRDQHEKTWRSTFMCLHNLPHNILFTKKTD